MIWFKELRPHFLLLTPITVFVSISCLIYEGNLPNLTDVTLVLIGTLLAHISVNVLNDYFDYKSGLDMRTKRTPFSGGSGMLVSGLLNPLHVKILGLTCMLLGLTIAIYFYFKVGWPVLILALTGAFLIYFYTDYLTKVGLAEVSAGLGIALMCIGSYYALSGAFSENILYLSSIVFLTTANLLLLNEFPDTEVDKVVGRRHVPAKLGFKRASYAFTLLELLSYVILAYLTVTRIPLLALTSLTVPLAFKTCKGVLENSDQSIEQILPYLGLNVKLVFSKLLLVSISLIIYKIIF